MRSRIPFALLLSVFCLCPLSARADDTPPPSALQASNLLNPNVSVVGWMQAETGRRDDPAQRAAADPFALKEAEIAFQAVVDSYARADIFVSGHPDETTVEEAYLTWIALPYGLSAKTGRFRTDLGKFNRIHPGETAFADRPLVHEKFFGLEGLSGTGVSLAWNLPIPWFLTTFEGDAVTPTTDVTPTFARGQKKDLLYTGRLASYFDLTDAANVTVGADYATGPAGQSFDAMNASSTTLRDDIAGFDLTFRWKNPRRAIYHSAYWQTEMYWNRRELTPGDPLWAYGLFSHLEYQFLRRWRSGVRWDYTQSPTDARQVDKGALAYVTFQPTEFSSLSLQGRRARRADGLDETLGFFKIIFNIGPHGAHPF